MLSLRHILAWQTDEDTILGWADTEGYPVDGTVDADGQYSKADIPEPVSYTHLEVYKRQVYTSGVVFEPRFYEGLADMLKKALALLKPHEEYFEDDYYWNCRMGYSYFYLDQEGRALRYFEKALEARPGDEDTICLLYTSRCV